MFHPICAWLEGYKFKYENLGKDQNLYRFIKKLNFDQVRKQCYAYLPIGENCYSHDPIEQLKVRSEDM